MTIFEEPSSRNSFSITAPNHEVLKMRLRALRNIVIEDLSEKRGLFIHFRRAVPMEIFKHYGSGS